MRNSILATSSGISSHEHTAPLAAIFSADSSEKNTSNTNIKYISNLPILIIEDEPLIQRVHQMMLKNLGYQVDIAQNGKEALALYNNCQYAAILTDISMPEMSGIEVSSAIRHLETAHSKRIPIIALTADITDETKQACLVAGIDEVATKPIKSDALQALFQHYLGK